MSDVLDPINESTSGNMLTDSGDKEEKPGADVVLLNKLFTYFLNFLNAK